MVDLKRGELRRKADVMAEVAAILELFEQEIGDEKIQNGATYIERHKDSVLRYFDEVEAAEVSLKVAIPEREVRQGFLRRYAYQQQLYVAYGQRKRNLEAQRDSLQ
jgi:hypothetical protein